MRRILRAWPLLIAAALSTAAFGQAQPVAVARVSLSSIDDYNKLLADLGVPKDPDLDLQAHFESVPFIGAGGVATNKPVGISIMAADPQRLFPIEQNLVVSVPVTAGKVTAADITGAGGVTVQSIPDGFSVGGMEIRRTGDYVHAKPVPSAFGLSAATDSLFAADYRTPGTLVSIVADVAALRKAAPDAYQDLAQRITAVPRMVGIPVPDDTKPVLSALDKINLLSLSVSQDPANLELRGTLAPSPLPVAPIDAPRPAFPQGMIVRMHMVYPTQEAAVALENQLDTLPAETFGMDLPPVYHQRVKDLVLRLAAFNSHASAVSLAVGDRNALPVIYLVDQFRNDFDGLKETADLTNDIVALAQEAAGQKINTASDSYTAGTHKVQRITLSPDGAPPEQRLVIDEIQDGRTLYVTLASTDVKDVAALADAGMDGKSTALFAGDLDLPALMTAMQDAHAPTLPADMLEKLKTGWAGQKISWSLESTNQGLTSRLQVPKQVIRDLANLLTKSTPAKPPTVNLP